MARTDPDFIDRSIEVLMARDFVDSDQLPTGQDNGGTATLPQLNLLDQPAAIKRESNEAPPDHIATRVIETSSGPIWLCGNAVMCCCPDCEAPVSVRTWLMIADCWYCETAIELDYEQRRAAEELSREISDEPQRNQPAANPASAPPPRQRGEDEVQLNLDDRPENRRLVEILRQSMSTLPAWLISTLVHLILFLILALILLPQSTEPRMITLSTVVDPAVEEGGVKMEMLEEDPLDYDAPMPPPDPWVARQLRKVELAANQDARELLIDSDPLVDLPAISKIKESVAVAPKSNTLALRDPRLRMEIVKKEGGTRLSEAAVSRGLAWLASVQNHDGSWSLEHYDYHENPRNRGDAAATSLALLPFLGAGQTHEYGKYKKTVARGLKWLMDQQKSDGDLRAGLTSEAGMYVHGQAAIVLVEALAMTGDEQFRDPAQRAIDFIERAQYRRGGWRYFPRDEVKAMQRKRVRPRPTEEGDTSVLGWQLMALQSARGSKTGLRIDDATLELVDQYLDLASRRYPEPEPITRRDSRAERERKERMKIFSAAPSGTLYRYQLDSIEPKATMTAEALLCRMYLGWKRDDARMSYAVNWLLKYAMPDPDRMNLYYYYYATQVMHHYGGRQWETWNQHMRDLLIVTQEQGGEFPGSWDPDDFRHGDSGRRIYVTAFAICTLEVYYRHLPLFKQLDLD